MATAFERAAARLHANRSVTDEAWHRPLGRGLRAGPFRIIRSMPDEITPVFGQNIRSASLVIQVLRSDVASVEQGDVFDLSDRVVTVLNAMLDVEGVTWMVTCRDG